MVSWHGGTVRQDSGAWIRVVLTAEVAVLGVRPSVVPSLPSTAMQGRNTYPSQLSGQSPCMVQLSLGSNWPSSSSPV